MQKHNADLTCMRKEFDVNDKVMLSTTNLKLLNQPNKKFRSKYNGPYTTIKKKSSKAYELKLPKNMKVHPVLHISFLNEYFSKSPDNKLPDDIPAANNFINGDDHFYVHKILSHKIDAHPATYEKGPTLLFLAR